MRDLRRQNRKQDIDTEAILKAKKIHEPNDVIPTSISIDYSDLQTIQLKYEKKIKLLEQKVEEANPITPLAVVEIDSEIEALKSEILRLKDGTRSLNKNEKKIIAAIKSEVLNQSKDEPVISRSMLLKKYKMNSKYIDDSIKYLLDKGFAERKKIKYSANIYTYSWKIVSKLIST